MAILDAECPHCLRFAQMVLRDRLADNKPSGGTTAHTAWAKRYSTTSQLNAKNKGAEYLSKRDALIKKMMAGDSTQLEKLSASANLSKLGDQPPIPFTVAFSARCSFSDCGGPALLICSIREDVDDKLVPGANGWSSVHLSSTVDGLLEIAATFPVASGLSVHTSWPEVARRLLPELIEDVGRNRDPSRILSGARTVLDTCLRDLLGSAVPKGRSAQIDKLIQVGKITPDIGDWAKSLWKDGSDASHDAVGDRKLAESYLDFLPVFLRVTYTLPSEIADLRAR